MKVYKRSKFIMGIIIILCFSVLATACHTPNSADDALKDDAIYPADIQVGDSLDSFIYLNPRRIEHPDFPKNDFLTLVLWHPDEHNDIFAENSGENIDPEILATRREIRYYEQYAPEGTYTYRVKDKGYMTEDFYVESISFTPRENREFAVTHADFPLSELKPGDSFEKLLLFNPIRVTLLDANASHVDELYLHAGMDYVFDDAGNIVSRTPVTNQEIIKYKLCADGGEYVYTLRRPASNQGAAYKDFYISNIEFIESTP